MTDPHSTPPKTWRYRFARPGGEEIETGDHVSDEAAEARARQLSKAQQVPVVVERRGMVDWEYVTEEDERS